MTTVQDHYENFLGQFYDEIFRGEAHQRAEVQKLFEIINLNALLKISPVAYDLGSGPGYHAGFLKQSGFVVTGIDQSDVLLKKAMKRFPDVNWIKSDIQNYDFPEKASLILCMGDTLSHLQDLTAVSGVVQKALNALLPGGILILSFRDYTFPPHDTERFILTGQTPEKIFSCFVEDHDSHIKITDLAFIFDNGEWKSLKSSYLKIKIPPNFIELLCDGFEHVRLGMNFFIKK